MIGVIPEARPECFFECGWFDSVGMFAKSFPCPCRLVPNLGSGRTFMGGGSEPVRIGGPSTSFHRLIERESVSQKGKQVGTAGLAGFDNPFTYQAVEGILRVCQAQTSSTLLFGADVPCDPGPCSVLLA